MMYTDRSGDLICRSCGEVLAERLVDDSPEWNFYEDSKGDPSRVGGALDDRHERIFGNGGGGKKKRSRGSAGLNDVDPTATKRTVTQKRIASVCVRIDSEVRRNDWPSAVRETGMTIADAAEEKGLFRGCDEDVMLGALLFLACKNCGVPMTLKDIVAHTGADKTDVSSSLV